MSITHHRSGCGPFMWMSKPVVHTEGTVHSPPTSHLDILRHVQCREQPTGSAHLRKASSKQARYGLASNTFVSLSLCAGYYVHLHLICCCLHVQLYQVAI